MWRLVTEYDCSLSSVFTFALVLAGNYSSLEQAMSTSGTSHFWNPVQTACAFSSLVRTCCHSLPAVVRFPAAPLSSRALRFQLVSRIVKLHIQRLTTEQWLECYMYLLLEQTAR
jgi:molybdopterin-biosynthesis enzyme MoeA-like protein